MAKIYGQLEYAQMHNASADLTPTSSGLLYFNTSSSEPKIYNGSTWKTLLYADFGNVTGTLAAARGGTGVSNSTTATWSHALIFTGGAITFTATGSTGVTLPTSGTLATLAGTETLTNKTFRADDGDVDTGGLSFTADTDTGFWRSASGTVNYSSDGVKTLQLDNNGITVHVDGSAYNTVKFGKVFSANADVCDVNVPASGDTVTLHFEIVYAANHTSTTDYSGSKAFTIVYTNASGTPVVYETALDVSNLVGGSAAPSLTITGSGSTRTVVLQGLGTSHQVLVVGWAVVRGTATTSWKW